MKRTAIGFSSKAAVWVAAFTLLWSSLPAFAAGNVIVDPDKFGNWTVVGPNGGDVRVVTIDPKDKDRLYISTLDGQIHTSADAGKTWRLLVNLNEPQLILDQLMVDSRDSKIIYTSGHRFKAAGGFFRQRMAVPLGKKQRSLGMSPFIP